MTASLGLVVALTICPIGTDSPPRNASQAEARPAKDRPPREQPRKWWDDQATVKSLHLSGRQRARIRSRFESWVPGQRARAEELRAADQALSDLLDSASFDVNAIARAVERLEEIRWRLSRSRSLMLLELLSELNIDQRKQLRESNASASPGRERQKAP